MATRPMQNVVLASYSDIMFWDNNAMADVLERNIKHIAI